MLRWLRAPQRRFLLGWDAFMVVLAIVSVALVVYYEQAEPATKAFIVALDYAFVAVFLLDFAWDVFRADDRGRYLRRNWWALLGMVPLGLTDVDYLRFLRIVRALRILRAFRSLAKFLHSAQRAVEHSHIGKLALISGALMLVGSVLVWFAERDSNPALASYWESLWWSIVTITTVGYGDITPETALGRLVASALMVAGIGTIGLLAGQVGSHLVGERQEGGAATDGVALHLERLAALRRAGDLSDAEFAAAKAKVLAPADPQILPLPDAEAASRLPKAEPSRAGDAAPGAAERGRR